MLISEILEELKKENMKVSDVAKIIEGVSEKPLREALKGAGYAYSNKAPKGWHFIGEGEEPLHTSIFDYVKPASRKGSTKRKSPVNEVKVNNDSHQSAMEVNKGELTSPINESQFTQGAFSPREIQLIKEMLQEWTSNKAKTTKIELLHERIKQLDHDDKQRRTIIINRKVGADFDQFCKEQRFNKSDIIELAIMDFIEKYS